MPCVLQGVRVRSPRMLGNCINPLNSQLAMTAVTINLNPIIKLTDDQFYHLCRVNPDVKFERNAKGEIIIVSPTGGETGKRNAGLTANFVIWN